MLNREVDLKNKFHFTSLGCARNLVDSEVMIGILIKAGYEIVSDPEDADYLVINTCGFLEASRLEAIETIEEIFSIKKNDAKVIIAGCMVQKHKKELTEQFPKIHYMLGSGDVEKILEAIQTACQLAKTYGAKITAVYVLSIPISLPMHARMERREEVAEAALKRAEAVAREYQLNIDLKLVRARTVEGALLDLVSHGEYDLVVVGARKEEVRQKDPYAIEIENLLKSAPCRVLFCKS